MDADEGAGARPSPGDEAAGISVKPRQPLVSILKKSTLNGEASASLREAGQEDITPLDCARQKTSIDALSTPVARPEGPASTSTVGDGAAAPPLRSAGPSAPGTPASHEPLSAIPPRLLVPEPSARGRGTASLPGLRAVKHGADGPAGKGSELSWDPSVEFETQSMNGVAKPFRGPRRSRQSHGGSSASSKTSRQTDGELVVRNIVDMAASPASLRMSMRRRASLEATADGQEILCAAQSNKTARQRWRTAVRKIILTNMVSSQFSTLREMHSVPAIHPTQLQFIRQLGAGTFGRVQLMKLRKAGTPSSKVAMKILRRSTLTRSSCQDFVNEVSILRRLRHPNIIRFLGIGDDQGSPVLEPQVSLTDAVHTFLVLEYCSGGSLKDLIKKQMANGPGNLVFGHRDAFAWLCDVAEGLVYLHKSIPPVVHRDIKPDNVMLAHVKGRFGSGYTAKISDFGTSKVLGVETIMQKSVTFRKTVLRLSATGEAELADTAGGRSDFAPRESLGGAQSAVSEYLRQSVHLQRSVPSGELRVMEEKKRTAEMSRSQRNSALTDGGGSSHGARGAPHGVDVGSALELPPTPTPRTPGLEGLFPPLAEDEEEEEEEGYEGVLGKLAFEGSQREVTRPSLLARLFPCLGPKVAAVAPEQPAPAKDAKYAPLDLTGGTGSLLYMAPEVFRSEKYNARADVFSLGMLALELFSRCPLTTTHNLACSDDVVHFAQSISNGWRPDIPKKLPPPFKDFVKACLEHDPAVRPSAHAVVRMLQEMTPAMLKWAQQQDIAMARASMKYRAATEDQR